MKGNDAATCPRCGSGASGFTAIQRNVHAKEGDIGASGFTAIQRNVHAKEGDIAVCAYCRGINVYRADLTLRLPTEAEGPRIRETLEAAGFEIGASA